MFSLAGASGLYSISLGGYLTQHPPHHLRPAIVAQRVLAAYSATDVQHRWPLPEHAAIVAAAIAAGHQQGAEQRQAHLSTVDVAGEHQVNGVPPCPGHVVGRVAQAQTKDT